MTPSILSIISLFLLFYSEKSFSEIRKYQYLIVNSKLKEKDQQRATITIESLSPTTNSTYHGHDTSSRELLLRTWRCPGTSGRKVICNPRKIFKN